MVIVIDFFALNYCALISSWQFQHQYGNGQRQAINSKYNLTKLITGIVCKLHGPMFIWRVLLWNYTSTDTATGSGVNLIKVFTLLFCAPNGLRQRDFRDLCVHVQSVLFTFYWSQLATPISLSHAFAHILSTNEIVHWLLHLSCQLATTLSSFSYRRQFLHFGLYVNFVAVHFTTFTIDF